MNIQRAYGDDNDGFQCRTCFYSDTQVEGDMKENMSLPPCGVRRRQTHTKAGRELRAEWENNDQHNLQCEERFTHPSLLVSSP